MSKALMLYIKVMFNIRFIHQSFHSYIYLWRLY